eukprot:7471526-Ditylum_brightwellii.AAC.1
MKEKGDIRGVLLAQTSHPYLHGLAEIKSECETQLEIMCEHRTLERLAQLKAELVKKDKLLGEMKEQNQK